jgi:hypothetical protein
MAIQTYSKEKILHLLIRIYGFMFLLIAIFHYDLLAQIISGTKSLSEIDIPYFQITCLFIAIPIFVFDLLIGKNSKLKAFFTRNTILNSLLIFLSVCFPITILELGLRPFCTFVHKDASIFQKDDVLGWRLRPNSKAFREALIKVNAKGIRGPERAFEKSGETNRVLFLGDSITYGLRLNYSQCIPHKVEMALNEKSDFPIECINTGVPGYSTWQEFLYYQHEGYKYQPDIVVLSFCLNDVLNTYTGIKYGDYGKDDPVPFIEENWVDYLIRRSSIVYAGKQAYHKIRYGMTLKENAIYREGLGISSLQEKSDYPEIKQAWETTNQFIEKIADKSREQNAQFLLVVFPYIIRAHEVKVLAWSPKPLFDFAAKKEYTTLDFMSVIQSDMKRTGRTYLNQFFQDACHPTDYAAELAAKTISDEIMKQGWLVK